MAELDAANHEIAHQMDDLVRVLVENGVVAEERLPASLRTALDRRRKLLELLGLPVS